MQLRWGLVPRWAKDPSIGARMINARGETLADKPSFQMPYRRHRCLLPADGFYEWQAPPARSGAGEAARKQPIHIGMADGSLFGLAGLYERWRSEDGKVLDTCTIVTTPANALLAPIHDRMPLIVARQHYTRWLDPANDDVGDLIVPFPPRPWRTTRCRRGSTTSATTTPPCSTGSIRPPPRVGAEHEPPPPAPEQESLF